MSIFQHPQFGFVFVDDQEQLLVRRRCHRVLNVVTLFAERRGVLRLQRLYSRLVLLALHSHGNLCIRRRTVVSVPRFFHRLGKALLCLCPRYSQLFATIVTFCQLC